MIEEHFGLDRAPFRLAPDSSFIYQSESHRRAMAHLRYGIRQAEGFVLITGEAGVGKTVLVEHLLSGLEGTETLAALLPPGPAGGDEMAKHVLEAFGQSREDGSGSLRALEEFLRDRRNEGQRACLIIDEAQRLSNEALEALRLLSNLTAGGEALLQICLIGQPELRERLYRPEMDRFRQRILASYAMPPLGPADVGAYLSHRMRAAGWKRGDNVFTAEAAEAIHAATKGVPRRVNMLAARLLAQAAMRDAGHVGAAEVEEATQREDEGIVPDPLMPGPAVAEEEEPTSRPSRRFHDAYHAEIERKLALLTAPVDTGDDAPEAEAEQPLTEEDAAQVEEPVAAQLSQRNASGPVTVGDINAAIRSIQERPAEAPRLRATSPQELMLAGARRAANDAVARPPDRDAAGAEAGRKERPPPVGPEATPAEAPAEASSEAPNEGHDIVAGFVAEVEAALDELRGLLGDLRERTDALDAERRARRAELGEKVEEAMRRLSELRRE